MLCSITPEFTGATPIARNNGLEVFHALVRILIKIK